MHKHVSIFEYSDFCVRSLVGTLCNKVIATTPPLSPFIKMNFQQPNIPPQLIKENSITAPWRSCAHFFTTPLIYGLVPPLDHPLLVPSWTETKLRPCGITVVLNSSSMQWQPLAKQSLLVKQGLSRQLLVAVTWNGVYTVHKYVYIKCRI